jgi:hypothetical protein
MRVRLRSCNNNKNDIIIDHYNSSLISLVYLTKYREKMFLSVLPSELHWKVHFIYVPIGTMLSFGFYKYMNMNTQHNTIKWNIEILHRIIIIFIIYGIDFSEPYIFTTHSNILYGATCMWRYTLFGCFIYYLRWI